MRSRKCNKRDETLETDATMNVRPLSIGYGGRSGSGESDPEGGARATFYYAVGAQATAEPNVTSMGCLCSVKRYGHNNWTGEHPMRAAGRALSHV